MNKRVYNIKPLDLSPEEVDAFLEKTKNRFKSQTFVDAETGEVYIHTHDMDLSTDISFPRPNEVKNKPTLWQRIKNLFKND